MWKAAKKVISPRTEEASYTDTYFREIGFKFSKDNASTESPDLDRGLDSDFMEEVSLENDEERAVNQPSNKKVQHVKTSPHNKMALTYGVAPVHAYYSQNHFHQDDDVMERKSKRYGCITLRDDVSISTLGEESIKQKSPNGEGQSVNPFKDPQDNAIVAKESAPSHKTDDSLEVKQTETGSTDDDSEVYSSYGAMLTRRKKFISFLIAFSTILLVASGTVLAVAIVNVKQNEKQTTATSRTQQSTWEPQMNRTIPPKEPTVAPEDPAILALHDLIQIIERVSPKSLHVLEGLSSAQLRAVDWLSQDPDYSTYSVERIVQRWAMAVVSYSLGAEMWTNPESRRSLLEPTMLSWEHECQWFSTEDKDICDGDFRIIGIYLDNKGLTGTIPAEIALLQDSLEQIYLSSNAITGVLPTELGELTNLVRLQLTNNAIEGSIPVELAFLTNLAVLGLGRNHLVGEIPSELGNLKHLRLEGNFLEGSIPEEMMGMESLAFLNLQSNQLEGEIPSTFGALYQLQVFSIHRNNVNGTVPEALCWENALNQTISMIADCSEIDCPCCSFCCIDCDGDSEGQVVENTLSPISAPPTTTPTAPIAAPSSTSTPTAPIAAPPSTSTPTAPHSTSAPTVCEQSVTVDQSCYLRDGGIIQATFENCEPTGSDWIGVLSEEYFDVYKLNNVAPSQAEASMWSHACGDQVCDVPTLQNVVAFTNQQPGAKEGNYRMYLVRDGVTAATSDIFEISRKCQ